MNDYPHGKTSLVLPVFFYRNMQKLVFSINVVNVAQRKDAILQMQHKCVPRFTYKTVFVLLFDFILLLTPHIYM